MNRGIGSVLALTASVVALTAPAYAGTLHWSGDVDDTATIYISGRDVRVDSNMGGVHHEHHDLAGKLPDHPVRVWLEQKDGRGHIRLVQEPGPGNGFTAAVRVHDKAAGRAHYDFILHWQGPGHHGPGGVR